MPSLLIGDTIVASLPWPRSIQQTGVRWWPALALLALALSMRIYRLDSTLLWLDETYTFQLARLGPVAIWQNVLNDPHPPMFYVLEWLMTGFGSARWAWAWRLAPMLCGALCGPLFYLIAQPLSGTAGALLGGLALALSPTNMYFSQEARAPTLLWLLSTLALLLVLRLLHHARPTLWGAYAAVIALGITSDYAFVCVPMAQFLVLLAAPATRRAALWCMAGVALLCSPLLLLGHGSLSSASSAFSQQDPPRVALFLMSLLGGDLIRYGQTWAHVVLLGTFLALILIGVRTGWATAQRMVIALCLLQVLLPLVGFFGVGVPLLGLRLPLNQAKAFLVILPALYLLAALGAGWLSRLRLVGTLLIVGLIGLIAAGELYNLGRYWSISKSREGDLVMAVLAVAQPGDNLISFAIETSGVLSFYQPDLPTYSIAPGRSDAQVLAESTSIMPPTISPPATHVDLAQVIRPGTRVWVLYKTVWPIPAPFDSLIPRCAQSADIAQGPFRALLLTNCP